MSDFVIDGIDFQELEAEKYWSFNVRKPIEWKKEERNKMIYSGQYWGTEKKDGAYYRFIKGMNGNMRLQGRSRNVHKEFLNKIENVPHLNKYFESLPNGTCLLGEIYYPEKSGSNETTKIMGCLPKTAISRQKGAYGFIHYWVFDIWAWDGISYLDKSYENRMNTLENISSKYTSKYVEYAKVFKPNEIDLVDKLNDILSAGGEGMVITKIDSVPAPGKRTAHKTLKIKKELQDTIDVVIMGGVKPTRVYTGKEIETWSYWQNELTNEMTNICMWKEYHNSKGWTPITKPYYYGWAGSLSIGAYRDGKLVKIGQLSGIDDEIKANWKNYIGKVAEITAMQIGMGGETKGLRHPRFLNWREDKSPTDCKYEDIFG